MMPTFTALWSRQRGGVRVPLRCRPHLAGAGDERPAIVVITGDAMARPLIDAYRSRARGVVDDVGSARLAG